MTQERQGVPPEQAIARLEAIIGKQQQSLGQLHTNISVLQADLENATAYATQLDEGVRLRDEMIATQARQIEVTEGQVTTLKQALESAQQLIELLKEQNKDKPFEWIAEDGSTLDIYIPEESPWHPKQHAKAVEAKIKTTLTDSGRLIHAVVEVENPALGVPVESAEGAGTLEPGEDDPKKWMGVGDGREGIVAGTDMLAIQSKPGTLEQLEAASNAPKP